MAGTKFLSQLKSFSMSYSMRKKNYQEDKRLNVDEEHELLDWTERYGVPAERIREAVRIVGNKVNDVVRYLMDGNKSKQLTP